MRKYVIGIVIGVLFTSAVVVLAGDLEPPFPPVATSSYTLEDIYYRLDAGIAGTQSSWSEPLAGPGSTGHTLDQVMALAPAVDDTDGAAAADVASGKTFWGLTSGAWGLQTGTASGGGGAGVPKTGQTTGYRAGDDGDLQKGVDWPSPRFTDNGNGTVTDNLTGLIWLKNADCWGSINWNTAIDNSNALASGSCGLTDGSVAGDWRLPNLRELYSLVDFSQVYPALPSGHPFTSVQSSSAYWSSTTAANGSSDAWYVNLIIGLVDIAGKTYTNYVWPVRGE
jgi:hypothetical protein